MNEAGPAEVAVDEAERFETEDVGRSAPHQPRASGKTSEGLADSERIKNLIVTVLQATLFENGLIQKIVDRAIGHRLDAWMGEWKGQSFDAAVAAAVAGKQADARKEIAAVVQKEIATALSSENLKILIDDKFRAINTHLKVDVIPKVVANILKGGPK